MAPIMASIPNIFKATSMSLLFVSTAAKLHSLDSKRSWASLPTKTPFRCGFYFNLHQMDKHMNAILTTPQPPRVTLYYREGSSDKVYHASIEPQGEGFVVNIAYGRRGSTMNTGTKTQTPVAYEAAKTIYEKLIGEKTAKGYTQGPDGTPYQNTSKEDRVTDLLPQLLNPIDEKEVKRLLKDPAWCAQEKFDGRRLLLRKAGAEIHGINRKGLLIGLPSPIVVGAHKIGSDFILDGECVGDVLYAFDLLEWDGEDLRTKSYQRRVVKLSSLLNRPDITHIEFAEID